MSHPLTDSVHKFYIPVMGTGFTIDTPLKVARYGISSVVSLVDDVLIEQMRKKLSSDDGCTYEEIKSGDDDSRANRITSYLNMMDDKINSQVEKMRTSLFEKGSEITNYFEMLPDSRLKSMYDTMQATRDPQERQRLQDMLREKISAGGIDVNIMTKLDRDRFSKGVNMGPVFSDAMTALRGYAQSRVKSSVILSAGMNRKLFSYFSEFSDFFPDEKGEINKRIVLKVSDFRSALIQGKLLARKGLWVSEFRIESGLNCGGHAFGGKGTLLGPVLAEFHEGRERLREQLHGILAPALSGLGKPVPDEPLGIRVTVQGGIGTAEENHMLEKEYDVDGTGWGSPFLLVPEAINIDESHMKRIIDASENDVHLSDASPLGVPFWSLKTSTSEESRLQRIEEGHPGSACPKGFLISNTEFTKSPICTASRAYQRRKLNDLENSELQSLEMGDATDHVTAKACICHDLAGAATVPLDIDPKARTAVCCGPNTVYFSKIARLVEMVDHIYGRASLPVSTARPHMFLKELSLHLVRLKTEVDRRRVGLETARSNTSEIKDNLLGGIRQYHDQASKLVTNGREEFLKKLDDLRSDLDRIKEQS